MPLHPQRVDFDRLKENILGAARTLLQPGSRMLPAQWHGIFQDVYAVCIAKPENLAPALHDAMQVFFAEHVDSLYQELAKEPSGSTSVLSKYRAMFEVFQKGSSYLDVAFGYYNTSIIKLSEEVAEQDQLSVLLQIALQAWRERLVVPLSQSLRMAMFAELERDRAAAGSVSLWDLRAVLSSFVALDKPLSTEFELLKRHFFTEFLERTKTFFAGESAAEIARGSVSTYLAYAERRTTEELQRILKLVPPALEGPLRECLYATLVHEHIPVILREFPFLLERQVTVDLCRVHRLLQNRSDRLPLVACFQSHVEARGFMSFPPAEDTVTPELLVAAVSDAFVYGRGVCMEVFTGDVAYADAVGRACRVVLNSARLGPNASATAADLLARFCDNVLRKGTDNLDRLFSIFVFLEDKDIFQRVYCRLLARRLVHALYAALETEEASIERLQRECGCEYTSKMKRMFLDVSLSDRLNAEFVEHQRTQGLRELPARFLVLQTGVWPFGSTATGAEAPLPPSFSEATALFKDYYETRFKGRKLLWLNHIATVDLRALLAGRTYELSCTLGQYALLNLFQDTDEMATEALSRHIDLPPAELDKIVSSLVAARIVLVNADRSSVSINTRYAGKRRRVKLMTVLTKETTGAIQQVRVEAEDDRSLYLQAAIVRVMKMRKELSVDDLQQEVVAQCKRFVPNIPQLKRCIEILIEKDYLKRSELDKKMLQYSA
eukprot:m.236762 g.236762  ORF g.236762 m.236762 type:complete len:722 (-) comp20768_c0_seq1:404-2569(-)